MLSPKAKLNQKGFANIVAIIIALLVLVGVGAGYLVVKKRTTNEIINSKGESKSIEFKKIGERDFFTDYEVVNGIISGNWYGAYFSHAGLGRGQPGFTFSPSEEFRKMIIYIGADHILILGGRNF